MTLRLDDSAKIKTLRVPDQMQSTESSVNFVAIDRKLGLMLSCLYFLGRAPQHWTSNVGGKLIYAR
jgi:hypothetical protein